MRKYLVAYKNALSSFFQYRLNLGLLLVSHLVSFSGVLYLWTAVYRNGEQVGNYSLTEIILYYVVLMLVLITIANGVGMGFQASEEINQGNVTNYLLKPYSYPLETLAKLFGEATINTLLIAPIVFLLAWFGKDLAPIPSPQLWFSFITALVIGEVFYFLFYFLAALSSFWVTRGRSFVYGMLIINLLLNGSLLPLDLFPKKFQIISHYLPFQFLIYTPIQTLLGRDSLWGELLLIAALWMAIMTLLLRGVWKLGIKKFEAVGR